MVSFGKYKLKSGETLWRVAWRDECDGQHTKRGFKRKSDAQAWWRSQQRKGTQGSSMTVADAWAHASEEADWKISTKLTLTSTWETHVEPRWGHMRLVDVRGSAVQTWLNELATMRSRTVVQRCRSVLNTAVSWALREGAITTSPLQGVRTPRTGRVRASAADDDEIRIPSPEAVAALAAEVGRAELAGVGRWRMLTFLAETGCRWAEAAALRVGDVDVDAARARITRTATWPNNNAAIFVTPKTGVKRTIALTPAAMAVVRARMEEGPGPEELLLPALGGEPMRSPGRGRWWGKAMLELRERGVEIPPRLTPHDLRHYAATRMLGAGIPVATVARQLGHASPATTLGVYAGVMSDDLDAVAGLDG